MPDEGEAFDRALKHHATIWQQQLNQQTPPQLRKKPPKWAKYTKWPNPFVMLMKAINVTACEDHWLALVEFYGLTAAAFWFANFLPSPVELTRKLTMGSYKCGCFGVPIKGGPLDLIWTDKSASKALIGMSSPITTGLFYWWAGQTAYTALDTWHSVIQQAELCDTEGTECIIKDGDAPITGGEGDFDGEAALYSVVYDPLGRYPELGSHIEIYFASYVNVFMCGYAKPGPRRLTNVRVGIKHETEWVAWQDLGELAPNSVTAFSASYSVGISGSTFFSVGVQGHKEFLTVLPSDFEVTRFQVKVGAGIDWPNHSRFPYKGPLFLNCWQRYWAENTP